MLRSVGIWATPMEIICLRLVAAPLWAGFQFYGISLEFPSSVPYDHSFRVPYRGNLPNSFARFRRAVIGNRRGLRRCGQNFPHQPPRRGFLGRIGAVGETDHSHLQTTHLRSLRLMDTSFQSGYLLSGKEDRWRTINSGEEIEPEVASHLAQPCRSPSAGTLHHASPGAGPRTAMAGRQRQAAAPQGPRYRPRAARPASGRRSHAPAEPSANAPPRLAHHNRPHHKLGPAAGRPQRRLASYPGASRATPGAGASRRRSIPRT